MKQHEGKKKKKVNVKENEQNGNHNENLNRLQDQLPETDAKTGFDQDIEDLD